MGSTAPNDHPVSVHGEHSPNDRLASLHEEYGPTIASFLEWGPTEAGRTFTSLYCAFFACIFSTNSQMAANAATARTANTR